ncbi:hypothetical protein PF005_g10908 [Phytophthora fragariae]|uniref:Uncharacterized protein n=1 Tax=Phytophthora fragariae TaxID=53985 RepID=A0A6A3RTT7_9STRA|nr:hypothetical protein PF003_g4336 [Phytophthora fragariae]KAE8943374.1 hypothetical protein PF009_g6902 [Phytophthora fragariae]KAE8980774.1 hypothetical protein PF011_g22297 [Phytophthora fragariae]KAE9100228.1 hypothetical protein PF006_g22950 [Phytophthora fragariae]KAE9111941.1 hypothetical protein PF010_g10630 [Phytophthora fragariae]
MNTMGANNTAEEMNKAGATDTTDELDTAGATGIVKANDTAEQLKAAVKENDTTAENDVAGVNGSTVVSSTAVVTVDEPRACGERKLANVFGLSAGVVYLSA